MNRVATQPTVHFLFQHPAHFIALGGGAGLTRHAPGTVGTLVALPLAWLLRTYAGDTGFVVAICAALAGGVWAAQITGQALGSPDHGGIVIDEIAAFLVVLFLVGPEPRLRGRVRVRDEGTVEPRRAACDAGDGGAHQAAGARLRGGHDEALAREDGAQARRQHLGRRRVAHAAASSRPR
jgi:hypothetical protein